MTRLLCEPDDRLGYSSTQGSVMTVRSTKSIRGLKGLGSDGAEKIMGHAWFEGLDWESVYPFFVSIVEVGRGLMIRFAYYDTALPTGAGYG